MSEVHYIDRIKKQISVIEKAGAGTGTESEALKEIDRIIKNSLQDPDERFSCRIYPLHKLLTDKKASFFAQDLLIKGMEEDFWGVKMEVVGKGLASILKFGKALPQNHRNRLVGIAIKGANLLEENVFSWAKENTKQIPFTFEMESSFVQGFCYASRVNQEIERHCDAVRDSCTKYFTENMQPYRQDYKDLLGMFEIIAPSVDTLEMILMSPHIVTCEQVLGECANLKFRRRRPLARLLQKFSL